MSKQVSFHWPCPIATTHEYITIILLLARNSTLVVYPRRRNICVLVCAAFLFCMDSNFYINHHVIVSIFDNFDLPFLHFCNSYTVEFYYQMFALYRHSVLFFLRLILLVAFITFQFAVHECVDTLVMVLIPLTLFTYSMCVFVCVSVSLSSRKSTISICLEYKRQYYNLP